MRGFTLVELVAVLLMAGLTLAAALPAARRQIDRGAVLAAREAVVAHVARTRREAVTSGGASLVVLRDEARLWIRAEGSPPDTLDLARRFGVRLDMASPRATLGFDGLGIGRLSSRTLGLSRGGVSTGITISAYGRVRRW